MDRPHDLETFMSRHRIQCGCGCGQFAWSNQMADVEIEQATDSTRRRTRTNRVRVIRACKKPYEEELGLVKCLQVIVMRWASVPRKTFWQKLNFLRTLDDYWMRIGAAIKVLRLNHAIYERPKGFEWARRHAMRSAILMGCPRFMQGFLAKRFRAQWERDNKPPEVVEVASHDATPTDPIEAKA